MADFSTTAVASQVSTAEPLNRTMTTPDIKNDPNLAAYCNYCLNNAGTAGSTTTGFSLYDDEYLNQEIEEENSTIDDNALCQATKGLDNILLDRVLLIPAFAIIVCLALFLQRRFLYLNLLKGRPGFIYPINLLEGHKHRYGYVAAFVVVSLHMFDMVVTTSKKLPYYSWEIRPDMKAFFVLAASLMKALEFYPVFACLKADNLFGYGIGTLYIWTLLVTFSLDDRFCFEGPKPIRALSMCKLLPPAFCMILLSLYFPYRFLKELLRISKKDEVESTLKVWQQPHNMLYVKELLNKHKTVTVPPTTLKDKMKHKIYWPLPTFKYSISMMTAVLTGLCFTYMAALAELKVMYSSIEKYKEILRVATKAKRISSTWEAPTAWLADELGVEMEEMYKTLIKECVFWVNWIIQPLIYLAIILAFLSVILAMLLTMKNYRHNLFMIYKNQHDQLQRADSFQPRGILLNGVKFVGYQISYAAWGFVIQSVLIFLITFFIASILMFMFKYHFWREILKWAFKRFWCMITTIIMLLVVQNLLAHFFFLLKGDDGHKVLAIDNRRFFFNFHYFAVFTNIAVGLISCILRIFRAVLFGLWTVPRLDMSTLSRDLERFDAGYMSYLGLLYLEHTQRNPTLLVFVNIMLQTMANENREFVTVVYEKKQITKKLSPEYKKVRNRYLLWLTLERNPGLRLFRKFSPSLAEMMIMEPLQQKRASRVFVPYSTGEIVSHPTTPARQS